MNANKPHTIVSVILATAASLVLLFGCMIVAVLPGELEKILETIFPIRDPMYPGMRIRLSEGKFVNRLQTGAGEEPLADVFVKVGDEVVPMDELTEQQLKQLGFEPWIATPRKPMRGNILSIGRGSPSSSSDAHINSSGELIYLTLWDRNIELSPNKDGPFITLGCTFDEFKEVFGKPIGWKAR